MKTSPSLLTVVLATASVGNISATFSASVQTKRNNQRVCENENGFTFTIANGQEVGCSWIIQSTNPTVTQKRRNVWCTNNQVVGSSCSEACGYCDGGSCADNPGYTFTIATGENVSCPWIVQSKDLATTQKRRKTWCDDNQEVRSSCPLSCGDCGCKDDVTFKFQIRNGELRDCRWIDEEGIAEQQRQNRLNRWCDGVQSNVVNYCPESCGKCNAPTASPSASPTASPTAFPTISLSSRPSSPTGDGNPTPSTPKTKAPSTPKTKAPSTPKTKAPSTPKTKAPSTPKTKAPSTLKTKAPSTPKTKAPSTPKTKAPKSAPLSSASSSNEVNLNGSSSSGSGAAIGVSVAFAAAVFIGLAFMLQRRLRRNVSEDDEPEGVNPNASDENAVLMSFPVNANAFDTEYEVSTST